MAGYQIISAVIFNSSFSLLISIFLIHLVEVRCNIPRSRPDHMHYLCEQGDLHEPSDSNHLHGHLQQSWPIGHLHGHLYGHLHAINGHHSHNIPDNIHDQRSS